MKNSRWLAVSSIFAIALLLGCDKQEAGGDKGGTKAGGGSGPAAEPPAVKKVLAVKAGALSTCALIDGGTVRCWGGNTIGQLGIGKKVDEYLESYVPVDVAGLTGVKKLWNEASASWGGGHSDGYHDTLYAQMADGAMKAWGNNNLMYGNGDYEISAAPVDDAGLAGITDISAYASHACAVWPDKAAKCWGTNAFGVAGIGTDASEAKTPTPVKDFTDAAAVGCGQNHCCGLKGDGTVSCWGYSTRGQLGNGGSDKSNVPVAVTGLADATQLGISTDTSCALKKDGSVVCWGNGFGKEPKAVDGATGITALDAQGFTCGIKTDKTVVCWGDNNFGQLGDGTTDERSSKAAAVKGLAGAAQITVGIHHACALLEDGDVKCWGKNGRGQVGDGSIDDRTTPVSVTQLRAETLTPQAERPTALPTDGKVAEVAGVPAGCPSKVELEVKVKGQPFPFVVRHIEIAWAYQEMGFALKFRNYDKNEKNPWTMPRGGQGWVAFGLEKWVTEKGPDGKDKIVQKPIDKEKPYNSDMLGSYRVTNAAGIYDNQTQRGFNAGQITVTHLDDKFVCGDIDLSHDKLNHSLKGKFVAAVPPKK